MSSLQVFPTLNSVTRLAAGFLLCVASAVALADDGHGHGDAAPAAASTASPRIAAHSELFELVGIVDKGQMKVYLDRYATNEPVTGARIEYESGNNKGTAQPQPDGTYLVKFDALGKPGDLPFSFTVSAGPDTDLLAGDLDIEDAHDSHAEEKRPWAPWLVGAAAVLAALGIATFAWRKRSMTAAARLKS